METIDGYKCPYCDNIYQIKWYWQQHMVRKHEEHRPHSCIICQERFKRREEYKLHRQSHKQCSICQKEFSSFFRLSCHIRQHFKDYRFFCDICEKGFVVQSRLKQHQRNVHEACLVCDICGTSIKSKNIFENHMRTHAKDYNEKRDFKCEFCSRAFRQKRHLDRHIKGSHNENRRKHICDLCGKVLSNERSLTEHKNAHKGIKTVECKYCGRKFNRKNTLVDHLRTHTGEQPFKCTYCGKAFSQRSALQIHVRLHTGERPYACNFCQNKFVCKGALSVHVKNKHKDV